MGFRNAVVVMIATPTLFACANPRGAFGAVVGAAAVAAVLGCAASNAQNNCTPEIQRCPSGFAHGVDGRCHLDGADTRVYVPAEAPHDEDGGATVE